MGMRVARRERRARPGRDEGRAGPPAEGLGVLVTVRVNVRRVRDREMEVDAPAFVIVWNLVMREVEHGQDDDPEKARSGRCGAEERSAHHRVPSGPNRTLSMALVTSDGGTAGSVG